MTDEELETLCEVAQRIESEPNTGTVIVQEVKVPNTPDERVYVVRVHKSAGRLWVCSCMREALQPLPGMPSNYHENDEPDNRIGAPCPKCDCGGVLSSVVYPAVQV